jgi:hypothetical protein
MGQIHLSNNAANHTIIGFFRAARNLPLLFAVFITCAIIVAAVDIHYDLQGAANCVICRFIKSLSCGSDAAASTIVAAPECLPASPTSVYSPFFPRIPISSIGSRSPPFYVPAVTVTQYPR